MSPLSLVSFSTILLVALLGKVGAHLSSRFYSRSCPSALSIIEDSVKTAVSLEPRMGASLLRLHFHDCFVNGCDGSVLLDDTANFTGEKTAIPNANSARGFDVVDNIKSLLEKQCPGVVSCADILAVAARDSVVALGGKTWTVQLGRRDSTTASLNDANNDIPSPFSDLKDLLPSFTRKGFSADELVILSGAHTIGRGKCSFFRTRIYNETNIDSSFASLARKHCPSVGGDDNLEPIDSVTAYTFDNQYFTNLVNLKGLFHSDQVLFNNGSTASKVQSYSQDSYLFLDDFGKAMIKMGNLSPLTGTSGQIRAVCNKVNRS